MLEKIFDSKSKSGVLAYLLLSTHRFYSLSELVKGSGFRIQHVRATLKDLQVHGLVEMAKVRKVTVYRLMLNKKITQDLTGGLKSHLGKKADIVDPLVSFCKSAGSIKSIYLSGTFVGLSDRPVDILIVGKIPEVKSVALQKALKTHLGYEPNYAVMSEDDFAFRKHTFDKFLKEVFDYSVITLV